MPLIGLIQPQFCVCPKHEPGFPTSNIVVSFLFNELRWELIVGFVDIDGIVDHHCLSFLFLTLHNIITEIECHICNNTNIGHKYRKKHVWCYNITCLCGNHIVMFAKKNNQIQLKAHILFQFVHASTNDRCHWSSMSYDRCHWHNMSYSILNLLCLSNNVMLRYQWLEHQKVVGLGYNYGV